MTDLKLIDPKLVLYRFFGENGELLYIGKTIAVRERMSQHKSTSKFFELAHSVTLTRGFITERELLRAETAAIKAELPIYNVVDNPAKRPPPPLSPLDEHQNVCKNMPAALLEREYLTFKKLRSERLNLVFDQMILALKGDKEAELWAYRMTTSYLMLMEAWIKNKEELSNGFPSIFTDSEFRQVIGQALFEIQIESGLHKRIAEFLEQSTAEVPAR